MLLGLAFHLRREHPYAILPCMTSRGLSQLVEACATLARERVEGLSNADVANHITALHHAITLLEAQRSRHIRLFHKRRAFEGSDISTVAWLRRMLRITGPAAAGLVAVARTLAVLPAARAAFESGEIALPHAQVIAGFADGVGVKAARTGEQVLVDAARSCDAASVRRLAHEIEDTLEPDAAQGEADFQHDLRRLRVSPQPNGVVYLEGRLYGDDGAVVITALDSLMGPPQPGDDRTARQRRADALTEGCRRLLDSGTLPRRGGQKPHVNVTVSVDRLRGDAFAPPAHLDWIGPITTEDARRIACDAKVSTVIVNAKGLPIVHGPDVDVVPPAVRRALDQRDGGCIYGDCDCPGAWCDAHHLTYRFRGGETKLPNLGLLCRRHHRMVHRRDLILRRTEDGEWDVVNSFGEVIARRPRRLTLQRLIADEPRAAKRLGLVKGTGSRAPVPGIDRLMAT